jgi:hypothetical protein
LRKIADDLTDDLQRKANQGIRKKDWEQGIGSLASMEAVNEFLRRCEQRAMMHVEHEKRALERVARRKPGSNVTSLPVPVSAVRKRRKTGVDPETLPDWARERVKA